MLHKKYFLPSSPDNAIPTSRGALMKTELSSSPPSADGDANPFPLVWLGKDRFPGLAGVPDLRSLGTRDMRFHTSKVITTLAQGDWLQITHYNQEVGGIVQLDDLVFLTRVVGCKSVEELLSALTAWRRCGPAGSLVGAIRTLVTEAKLGGVAYAKALGDYETSLPSSNQGMVRSIEFGDEIITSGQISLAGSQDTGLIIHGFLERADPAAAYVLELPDHRTLGTLEEDGAALILRRTPVDAPLDLRKVVVRRVHPQNCET